MRRSKVSATVRIGVVLSLGSIGAVAGLATPASAAKSVVIAHRIGGIHNPETYSLDCGALGQGYVEGVGDNRTEARTDIDRDNNTPALAIARNTESFVFLSRVVTSVDLVVALPGTSIVTFYCTSDKLQGWRVLGSSRGSEVLKPRPGRHL